MMASVVYCVIGMTYEGDTR